MAKIKLKANLISEDDNLSISVNAIRLDNKIIYKENDIQVTLLINNNKIEMMRLALDYQINLIFEKNKNTTSTYKFIGGDKFFKLNTKTEKLKISDNKVEIKYELEDNKFSYTVEMEDL